MDHDHDFSALRNLLASTKLDMPKDTQVDEFLTEFHRRQRAQLFRKRSVFTRATVWVKERVENIKLIPSLSYGAAVAAIAITAFVSLTQEVQVTQGSDGQSKLTFRMPTNDASFAMVPGSFIQPASLSPKLSDNTSFNPAKKDSAATRYVLATSTSHGTYDATVAF